MIVGLSSCKITESIVFEHGPSNRFLLTNDFDAKELNPYRVGSYVILPTLKQSTHTEYTLWISMCSKNRTGRARLISASIASIGNKPIVATPISGVDSEYLPLRPDPTGLVCKNWSILTIQQIQLESIDHGYPNIQLIIDVVSNSSPSFQIRYEFEAKRERRSVFPT